MDLINNRYRITKTLKKQRGSSTYLCSDMWSGNKLIKLHIINSNTISTSLIDYYKNQFISIAGLNSDKIMKNYSFGIVLEIDNKINTEKQYLYSVEYINKSLELLEYIKDMDIFQTMDLFINICEAIHYIHLKGYTYNSLNLGNIVICQDRGNYKVKLKDIATIRLEADTLIESKKENLQFQIQKTLGFEISDRRPDMYALGVLLLTMLRKQVCKTNPQDELQKCIKELKLGVKDRFEKKEMDFLNRLIPIMEKLLTLDEVFSYGSIYDFVKEINESTNCSYSVVDKKILTNLNFHTPIVGRDSDIKSIEEAYNSMAEYKTNKRIFLVEGDSGTGKTRFLEEVKFLLSLKKARVYSSFKLNKVNDDKYMWEEILRRIILHSDKGIVEKFSSEIIKFVPGILEIENTDFIEGFSDHNKYRLLNRISEFIGESIKNSPSIIIIDNIHLGNDFTIDVLNYLCNEIINDKNIILVFSYKDTDSIGNKRFTQFMERVNKRSDSDTIHIKNLDHKQTGEMIKNILSIGYIPIKLSKKIHSKTYGNPLFITEVIKELYSNKTIYIEDIGLWHIDVSEGDLDYKELNIPNTIEQVVLNQLKGINEINHRVIEIISVFNNATSLIYLSDLLNIDYKKLESTMEELVNKGILSKQIEDDGHVYDVYNKVLKDIVYDRISNEEKIIKHHRISELLENRINNNSNINLDELIYHLEKSGDKEKVKKYSIMNAKEKKSLRDVKLAIKNLEKALSYFDENDELRKADLLIEIGKMYVEIEDFSNGMKYFEEAEQLSKSLDDLENQAKAYVGKAEIYIFNLEDKKVLDCLDKTWEILNLIECAEVELQYKYSRAILLVDEEKYTEAIELYHSIIERCGDEYIKIKGNTYRSLAYAYVKINEFERAIELYKKAVELLYSIGYMRGVLYAINNIGTVYFDNYEDIDTALEYFLKVRDLSKEFEFLSSELLGLSNVGIIFYNRYEYSLAYEYLETALKKALDANYQQDVRFLFTNLTSLCLDMNNYSKAYYYYKLTIDSSNSANSLFENDDSISADVYYTFGKFDEALKYAEKDLIHYKNQKSASKYLSIIRYYLLKILTEKKESYDSYIEEIINTSRQVERIEYKIQELSVMAIILYKKNEHANARRIFSEIERFIDENIYDDCKIPYYYAKGVMETGEESLSLLNKALSLAKERKNKLFAAKIEIELGDYYYSKNDYYWSITYYLNAFEKIRNLTIDIPDEFRLHFVNNHDYVRFLYRIIYIKEILIDGIYNDKSIKWTEDKTKVNSLEELWSLLEDRSSNFNENKGFMEGLKKQYLSKFDNNILNEKDIMANLGSDIIENIKITLGYLGRKTLASNILVVLEGEKEDLEIIASMKQGGSIPKNKQIFEKAKLLMEAILISSRLDNDHDPSFLNEDMKGCMCIPIAIGYSQFSTHKEKKNSKKGTSRVLGYLYLETDNILNNFNHDTLIECITFINYIAFMCEKYELRKIASIDKLTEAFTRKYLEDEIKDLIEVSNESEGKFSLILYDLDKFKNVNDRFGHQTGDEVLRKVSKIVMDNIPETSILGRYGGEEFVITLPDVDSNEALVLADEIREKIYKNEILGEKVTISVSMGIATYPIHGDSTKDLIEKADQALYSAKEDGRNRCEIWNTNIKNKTKPLDKLDGILTGNSTQDAKNVLAIVETIQLFKTNLDEKEKIYIYLGRIMETVGSQYGYLFFLENGNIVERHGRKYQEEEWITDYNYNEDIVKRVIENKQGICMIDWDDVNQKDLIAGLPMWNSILALPVIQKDEVKAIIYLMVSTKVKEFGINDLNIASVFSNIIHI